MLLRPAEPPDALAVARVHVRSWQVGYRSLLPDSFLERLRPEERAARYIFGDPDPQKPWTIVAVEDGTILGFATTSPSRDADLPHYGELCAMYVDPDHWGRGIGAALMDEAQNRLRQYGFAHGLLWMLAGNTRAERFYRGAGWLPDATQKTREVWGVTVEEHRFCRELASP